MANEIDEQECQRCLADAIEDFWSAAAKGTPVIDPDPEDDSRALVTFLWRDDKANAVLLLALPPDDTMPDDSAPDEVTPDDATPDEAPDVLPPDSTTPNNVTPDETLLAANADPSASVPLFAGFMRHITETDIWYAAWRVPLGRCASYCFLPCSSRKSIPGASNIPGVRGVRSAGCAGGTRRTRDVGGMDEATIRWVLSRAQPDPHNPHRCQNHQHQDHQHTRQNRQHQNQQGRQAHDKATLSLAGPVELVKPASSDDAEAVSHEPSPESGRPTVRQKLRKRVYGKELPKKMQNTALAPPKMQRPKPAPRVRTTAATKALRSQIRAIRADCKERGADPAEQKRLIDKAVEGFWETTGAQTPVICRDPTSRRHALITFFWRDEKARAVLLFANRITDEKCLKESLMKRLPDTDVWHITYRMERDWRASYCFIPAYDKKSLADIIGVYQVSIRKALDRGIADPRNPVVCKNRADNALSVVELPDAPPQPWLAARPQLTCRGNVTSHRMHDGHTVWVYEPPETIRSADVDNKDVPVLIMFDGDMWMRVERFHETLNNLIADGEIPPLYALLVETDDIAARWGELSEGSGVEDFVADDLLPWARRRWPITDDPARTIVAGQSLGALTALWAAAKRPDRIKNVIAQSASLWRGSLMERLSDDDSPLYGFDGRIYFECGKQEWVLLPLNRRLARLLKAQGAEHRYVEYNGGHDYACWRGGIANALRWITKGWTK